MYYYIIACLIGLKRYVSKVRSCSRIVIQQYVVEHTKNITRFSRNRENHVPSLY